MVHHSFIHSFNHLVIHSWGPMTCQTVHKQKEQGPLAALRESQARGRTPFPSQRGPQDVTREVQSWWNAWVPPQLREEASEAGGSWWSWGPPLPESPAMEPQEHHPHQPPWPLRSHTVVIWGLGSHYSEYLSAECGKETKSPSLPLPHLYRWLFVALTSSFKWVHTFYFPTDVK